MIFKSRAFSQKARVMSSAAGLMQIQSFIQPYVLAISSVVEAAVEILDSDLKRVGGTGDYALRIGEKINHTAFFNQVMKTGQPGLIKDVKREMPCRTCEHRNHCKELANMAYPIYLGSNVIGVIGIVAFTEEERDSLLAKHDRLLEFLKYMSILIESKLLNQRHTQQLEHQIDQVVSAEKQQVRDTPFLGQSPAVQEVLALVHKIRGSDSTVLISGESGTGKEVLARLIHDLSPRGNKLMTSINCGAIPENLVESELFGYDEGAFTGARKGGHAGKFEAAHESTLFLDEIGEMPLPVQTKLLRVLQDQTVQRLGGKRSIPVNVRIICATNRSLPDRVMAGSFRNDLYYRLNVIPISLPPLRERREDIPILLRHFISRFNQKLRKKISGLDQSALEAFMAYNWPGNVRELNNIIEYLANVVDGPIIRLNDLPGHFQISPESFSSGRSLKGMLEDHEKMILARLAGEAATVEAKTELARSLGISKATLYRKLSDYGLL